MIQRTLGRTGIPVSVLGLGGSTFGGGLYFRDDATMLRLIDMACDAGITFFDTSNSYGAGHSEQVLGKGLCSRRGRVVIATKGGLWMSPVGRMAMSVRPLLLPLRPLLRRFRRELNVMRDGQKTYSYGPVEMRRSLEHSLRRLRTDYVDVYQFYNVSSSALQQDDLFDVMLRFKDEGKVRACGVTVAFPEPLEYALRLDAMDTIQVEVNLIDRAVVSSVLPRATERGIGVIARSPLAQGLLTSAEGHLMAYETSHRTMQQLLQRRRQAEALRALERSDRTLAQAALRYVVQLNDVSTTVFSVTSEAELKENLGALNSPELTAQDCALIEKLDAGAQRSS